MRGQHRPRLLAAAWLLATGGCAWVGEPEQAGDPAAGPATDAAPPVDDEVPDAAAGPGDLPAPDAGPGIQTTVFSADDIVDTYLRMTAPSFNYGASDRMCVDATDDRKILLRADLLAIPASAQVVGAALHLWTGLASSDASVGSFAAYRMLESWDEGGADAAPSTASYDQRAAGTSWTAAGAGVGSRAEGAIGSVVPDAIDAEYVVDLDPAAVQGWIEDEAENAGLVIVTASGDGACFETTEFADPGRRPSLVVQWIAP
jgi:hypothetical protein